MSFWSFHMPIKMVTSQEYTFLSLVDCMASLWLLNLCHWLTIGIICDLTLQEIKSIKKYSHLKLSNLCIFTIISQINDQNWPINNLQFSWMIGHTIVSIQIPTALASRFIAPHLTDFLELGPCFQPKCQILSTQKYPTYPGQIIIDFSSDWKKIWSMLTSSATSY